MSSQSDHHKAATRRKQQLATLDAERLALEDQINKLSASLAVVKREIAHLSSAYTLPDDVWLDILEEVDVDNFW